MSSTLKRCSRKRTRNLFLSVIKKTLKKPEKLTVSEWAEKYRVLDEGSNFQGRWSNDITPYLVGIMDAFNDPYIREINFCKPTQVGGTEAMLNMLGWIIMNNAAPTMIVYPNDDLAKDISNDRIKPSLKKTPEIAERFYETVSKELRLKYRGMTIYLRGSGSASKLASKPIKYLFFDEIDKMEGASKKEASPYNLAKERTRTFPYNKKIYTCSTPTLKTNYVWDLHENADEQRQFFVPCPHCNEYMTLKFAQISFPEEGASNADRAEKAIYICETCGCEISDKEKIAMLRKGEWRVVNKKGVGRAKKVSFWINALYSRFLTWADIVNEFLDSKDDPEKLQNFVNSWLAEPWEDTQLKTTSDLVLERQTEYEEKVVPEWAELLTGGVDVQESCLYWTIRAWGKGFTSQNIAHGQALDFRTIENVMNAEYVRTDGEKMVINLCLVDSGDQTDMVYDFYVDNSDWAMPVKGASHAMPGSFKISTINKTGSKAFGMQFVLVDGGKYKDMIAGRMRRDNGFGSWMVYKGCDRTYAEMVTAEHKVMIKNKSGTKTAKWVPKTTHADNHYLDAEVYAMAAADVLGARFIGSEDSGSDPEAPTSRKNENNDTSEEQWIRDNEGWL